MLCTLRAVSSLVNAPASTHSPLGVLIYCKPLALWRRTPRLCMSARREGGSSTPSAMALTYPCPGRFARGFCTRKTISFPLRHQPLVPGHGWGKPSKSEVLHVAHLHSQNGDLRDDSGTVVHLKGSNWYGFNSYDQAMVQGLWKGDSALTQDFATIVQRMKLLGFNTVRLSIDFGVLALNGGGDKFATRQTNQTDARKVLQSVSPWNLSALPNDAVQAQVDLLNSHAADTQMAPFGTGRVQTCASVPAGDARKRFIWVARYFAEQGFYVVITDHLDKEHHNLTFNNDPAGWVQKWKDLVYDILNGPQQDLYAARIIADLTNEPDSREYHVDWPPDQVITRLGPATWEFMKDHYFDAMEAIWEVNKSTLVFIEGTGQGGYVQCWGDGFVTDPTTIRNAGLSDANTFFGALMNKPYRDNVVLSPHIYPPSIADSSHSRPPGYWTKEAMWERLVTSFGVLNNDGYAGHLFPICIGETGCRLAQAAGSDQDQAVMEALADFMLGQDGAATVGRHRQIGSLLWWSWSNSPDTGDIVNEGTGDAIHWNKIQFMEHVVGLQPWYSQLPSTPAVPKYWKWQP